MEVFIKAVGATMLAVILGLTVAKQSKDISLVLVIAVCSMIALAAMNYLQPVIDFFNRLQATAGLDPEMLKILLKAVGIGMLAQICGLICADSGNAALGKALQILASAVILRMTIPLLTKLMDLLEKILGEL